MPRPHGRAQAPRVPSTTTSEIQAVFIDAAHRRKPGWWSSQQPREEFRSNPRASSCTATSTWPRSRASTRSCRRVHQYGGNRHGFLVVGNSSGLLSNPSGRGPSGADREERAARAPLKPESENRWPPTSASPAIRAVAVTTRLRRRDRRDPPQADDERTGRYLATRNRRLAAALRRDRFRSQGSIASTGQRLSPTRQDGPQADERPAHEPPDMPANRHARLTARRIARRRSGRRP